MKAGEQVGAEAGQTTPHSPTLHQGLVGLKESIVVMSESLAEELNMSRSVLVTAKVGLLLQYSIVTFMLFSVASRSWLVSGNLSCPGHTEMEINATDSLVLESLCRNPAHRERFAALFLCLEVPALLLLLFKMLIDERNYGWKITLSSNFSFDDWTVFWIATLPRWLIYIVLPMQSTLNTTTATFGTFYAIFHSPVTYLLGFLTRLIVFPIAVFFPYPMHESIEVNLSKIVNSLNELVPQMDRANLTGQVNCFQCCQVSFESTWCVFVCFLLVNFSVVFWVLNIPLLNEEPRRGESREQYSDSVEFIRISEVSEDFSYEEEEGRVSATNEKGDNDVIVAESCVVPPSASDPTTCQIEATELKPTESGIDESVAVGSVEQKSDATVVSDAVATTTESEKVLLPDPSDGKPPVNPESEDKSEIVSKTSMLNKGIQTTVQHVNKGCQTFVPIHLHKKINKKTQVSPILVHAQTNTQEEAGTRPQKDAKKPVQLGHQDQTEIEASQHHSEASSVGFGKNGVTSFGEIHKLEDNCDLPLDKDNKDVEKINKKFIIGEGFGDKKDSSENDLEVVKNGCLGTQTVSNGKFGFAELSLIPRTLDFEKRIIRENQIKRINVDDFLSSLKSEDDRDVIFVDKELLLSTFRDLFRVAKVKETEEAVCPKTDEWLKKCNCSVHKLMKSLPAQEGQPPDEFDGLKMETEDDNCSDDESFFNGFRL